MNDHTYYISLKNYKVYQSFEATSNDPNKHTVIKST